LYHKFRICQITSKKKTAEPNIDQLEEQIEIGIITQSCKDDWRTPLPFYCSIYL